MLYKKHIKGGHMMKEHKELSPTKVQSRSTISMKRNLEWKTRETYYKVQAIVRREGTNRSRVEIPEMV